MAASADVEPTEKGYRITGEIDISNASDVAKALSSKQVRAPVLDLTGLDFMDSSGLAVIVGFAEGADGNLTLVVEEGGPVHRLLDLATLPYQIEVRGGD